MMAVDTPRELSSVPRRELLKNLAKLNPWQRGVQVLLLFRYITIAIEQKENSKQHARLKERSENLLRTE